MKLSATLTLWLSVVFAALCLAYGIFGWVEQTAMPSGPDREDARGFALYFIFLGCVGVAGAIVSWRMTRMDDGETDGAS